MSLVHFFDVSSLGEHCWIIGWWVTSHLCMRDCSYNAWCSLYIPYSHIEICWGTCTDFMLKMKRECLSISDSQNYPCVHILKRQLWCCFICLRTIKYFKLRVCWSFSTLRCLTCNVCAFLSIFYWSSVFSLWLYKKQVS